MLLFLLNARDESRPPLEGTSVIDGSSRDDDGPSSEERLVQFRVEGAVAIHAGAGERVAERVVPGVVHGRDGVHGGGEPAVIHGGAAITGVGGARAFVFAITAHRFCELKLRLPSFPTPGTLRYKATCPLIYFLKLIFNIAYLSSCVFADLLYYGFYFDLHDLFVFDR